MQKIGIYQHYWGPMGGGQRYIGFVAQILAEKNEVEILHHDPNFDREKFDEGMELDLSRVSFRCLPRPERPKEQAKRPFQRLKEESLFCREYSEPYDVFIESGDVPPVFNHAKKGVIIVHFPLVSFDEFFMHHMDLWKQQSWLKRWLKSKYQNLEWRCRFGSYHRYLCNSKFTQYWCRNRWGIAASVLNPPLRGSIQPMEKQPVIAALGAFSQVNHKRQDVLIEAFRQFCDTYGGKLKNRWSFRLVGACKNNEEDLAFVEKLRERAAGYPIEILLNVDSETLRRTVGTATCVWHAMGYGVDEEKFPGKTEHFGMIATEAMAAGAIPLVYHAGGLPEIIRHNRNGFLWSTIDELVSTTGEIVQDADRLAALRTAALAERVNYDDDAFREHLRSGLRGIVDEI